MNDERSGSRTDTDQFYCGEVLLIQIIIWELCKDSVKKRISHSTLRQAVFAQSLNGTGIEIVTTNLDNFILYISVLFTDVWIVC